MIWSRLLHLSARRWHGVLVKTGSDDGDQSGERGTAPIELALIVPVFFMLIFGALDLGITVALYGMTSEAARDGARAAQVLVGQGHASSFSASENTLITTAASDLTSPLAALGNGLTVVPTMQQDANGYWYVTVTASTTRQPVVGTFLHIGTSTLSATSSLAVPCGKC